MIIQCTSCSRKFLVKDKDIPAKGRTVQCGFCSVTWYQKPVVSAASNIRKTKKNIPPIVDVNEGAFAGSVPIAKASDGNTYKFLGAQWARLLPSGKTGLFAKKKIGIELNRRTGRKVATPPKNKTRFSEFDPSSEAGGLDYQLPEVYKQKKGIGFFGYVFLLFIISVSAVIIIKTFEDYLLNYYPESKYLLELLDVQIDFATETLKNIITIVKDLINSY